MSDLFFIENGTDTNCFADEGFGAPIDLYWSDSPTLGGNLLKASKATAYTGINPPGVLQQSGSAAFLASELTPEPGWARYLVAVLNQDDSTPDYDWANDAHNVASVALPKVDTATSVTSSTSPLPSVSGQAVTFTATVSAASGANGTPTGSVEFFDGSTDLGGGTLSGGVDTITEASLPVGLDTISAQYSGDTQFFPSNGSVQQTVNLSSQTDTTTTVVSLTNPSVYGQPISFTVTVSAASGGTPTGRVDLESETRFLGSGVLVGGVATITIPGTSVPFLAGLYTLTAQYYPDEGFSGSEGYVQQTVNEASTTINNVSSDSPQSIFGDFVTFTATVSAQLPSEATPSGLVQFFDGGTKLGAPRFLDGHGVATYKTLPTELDAGTHFITAQYYEERNDFLGSTTVGNWVQTVGQEGTTTTLTTTPPPFGSEYGQSLTFTATVVPDNFFAGGPSGYVDFLDNGVVIDTEALTGSTVTFRTNKILVGDHAIWAEYRGNKNFALSDSDPYVLTVEKDFTSFIGLLGGSSVYGQALTIDPIVSVYFPAPTLPTGYLVLYDGTTPIASVNPFNGYGAVFTRNDLTAGTHTLTVVYSGDDNFQSDALSWVANVAPAATGTIVTSSANPAVYGQQVTFTATLTNTSGTGAVPTGTVQFIVDGSNFGAPVAVNATGLALSLPDTFLSGASHTVKAVYTNSDGNFLGSNSTYLTQTVQTVAVEPGLTNTFYAFIGSNGATSNDTILVNSAGGSNTGSTGVTVQTTLNGVTVQTTYSQSFSTIYAFLQNGNENVQLAKPLTINTIVTAGNGNDNVTLGNGNNTVTLGDGNGNIQAGSGSNTVMAGNGNDNVQLGDGNNNVTVGNGTDNVSAGNGSDVIVEGNGTDSVTAGNGSDLVVGGLGQHTIQLGNGNDILIDGSATVVNPGDSLRQILSDWNASPSASVDTRLKVVYNTTHPNVLKAGSGRDWWFYTYSKDVTNKKATDRLN